MSGEESARQFWYALVVKSRHEKLVATALRGKGYRVFLPLYRSRHRGGRGMRDVELPLFPTYLFSRFDPARRLPIMTTPGVLSIVAAGKTLLPVDEMEVETIRRTVSSGLRVEPCLFLSSGQAVCVTEGPLRGCMGILQRVKNEQRLVISVDLLQRSVAVEIDRNCLCPLDQPSARVADARNP